MNQQTSKTLEIVLTETTDPNGLFVPESDMAGVDVAASMARYDELLLAAVSEAFPEAEVSTGEHGRIYDLRDSDNVNYNPENTTDTHEAGLVVQQLADDILNNGDWIVTT